jgi:type III secretion protein Y
MNRSVNEPEHENADRSSLMQNPTQHSKRLSHDAVDLLHCLGYVYLRHGQSRRAIVLLFLAVRHDPRPLLLAALALALVEAELGNPAIDILDRLAFDDPVLATDQRITTIRARALLAIGRQEDAQALFKTARGVH